MGRGAETGDLKQAPAPVRIVTGKDAKAQKIVLKMQAPTLGPAA
jgi:hypothetical protein